jgi:hypothetical protein
MKRKPRRKQLSRPRSILKLPDLEAAKSAVLNSISCPDAQRGYRHANGRIRGVVLLGAAPIIQQDRGVMSWSNLANGEIADS